MASKVTETLAEWLHTANYDVMPATVHSKALDVVLDSVGGMIACSALPEVTMIVEFLEDMADSAECSVVSRKRRNSVVNAAMANAAMARGSEIDPVHYTTFGGHVASCCVPTALTVGQWLEASGKDVLRAITLGYEVGARLLGICYRERDYIKRRFYHTSVVGALSSAATAGALLGLDTQSLQVALGLGAYQAAGPDNMTKDPGHMGMTFQVAAANRNGVTAALLARKGCFVPLDILDGPLSFFDAFLGLPEAGCEMLKELGEYVSITDVMHKRYPVGSPHQSYLQGLLSMINENKLQSEDIQEVEIQMPKRSVHTIPSTRHASISGITVCAMALIYGKLDFDQLHDPKVFGDALVKRMEKRIRFVGREDWKNIEDGRHSIVTLTSKKGQVFTEEVCYRPMSRQELEAKFKHLVSARMATEKTARLETLLSNLESAATVKPLMQELEAI